MSQCVRGEEGGKNGEVDHFPFFSCCFCEWGASHIISLPSLLCILEGRGNTMSDDVFANWEAGKKKNRRRGEFLMEGSPLGGYP